LPSQQAVRQHQPPNGRLVIAKQGRQAALRDGQNKDLNARLPPESRLWGDVITSCFVAMAHRALKAFYSV